MDTVHQKAVDILTQMLNRTPTDDEIQNVLTDSIIMAKANSQLISENATAINAQAEALAKVSLTPATSLSTPVL